MQSRFVCLVSSIMLTALGAAALLWPALAAAKGSQRLSLDEFIEETIRNNPTVRAYILQHSEAKGQEFSARGIDDVNLQSLFALAKDETPNVSGISTDEDRQIAYGIGASKIISQSGTRVGLSYQNSWTNSDYPAIITNIFSPVNPVYAPSVTLSLTQPLLKNWLGRQDQLQKRLTRIGVELTKVKYEEDIEAFISEMTQLYLKWLRAFNDANLLGQVYRKLSEQVGLIRKQVDAKVSEESDLYRILEQQANYKALWEGAMAQFEGATREVAAMMEPDNPPSGIVPASVAGSFLAKYRSRANGIGYLKESSRLKQILDYTIASEEETLAANKNARLPDLNLNINYSRQGAASDFGGAHGSSFNYDSIGGNLQLAVPITDRAARGQYRAQKAKLSRVTYENDRIMLNATSQLQAFYEQEKRLAAQVKAYEQQVVYGRKKLQEEVKQFEDGRLSLFQLLQDQSTLISESLDLETSKVILASVRLLIGELTDVNFDEFQPAIEEVVSWQEE